MPTRNGKRLFAAGLGAGLALLLTVIAIATFADSLSGPSLVISSGRPPAVCETNQLTVPSTTHGRPISMTINGYRAGEVVMIEITFPDGRLLDLRTASALDGPIDTLNQKVPDMLQADQGGEIYLTYAPNRKWPAGCYTITSHGLSSGRRASSFLAVTAADPPAPVGTAALEVLNEVSGDPRGLAGSLIKMVGRGFGAGESIMITVATPNGAELTFPRRPPTSNSGEFAATFKFNDSNAPGIYTFVATGSVSGYRATAQFTLASNLPLATGDAAVTAIVTQDIRTPTNRRIEIQGSQFSPLEGVTVNVIRPDGTVDRVIPQQASEQGKFAVAFFLDQGAPAGVYQVAAEGTESKEVALTDFTLAAPASAPPPTATVTATTTLTPTATATRVVTPTTAPSFTPTATATRVVTPTTAPSLTPTVTATKVVTITAPSVTPTLTVTAPVTPTAAPSLTPVSATPVLPTDTPAAATATPTITPVEITLPTLTAPAKDDPPAAEPSAAPSAEGGAPEPASVTVVSLGILPNDLPETSGEPAEAPSDAPVETPYTW